MSIKVKAKRQGFYGNLLRPRGTVFDIVDEKDFSSRWMAVVDKPAEEAEEVEAPAKKKRKR